MIDKLFLIVPSRGVEEKPIKQSLFKKYIEYFKYYKYRCQKQKKYRL